MKKQLITLILCLILVSIPQASSMEEHEEANERALDQQIHQQHFHHRENVRENTACCHTRCLKLLPCTSWSPGNLLRLGVVLFHGCSIAAHVLMMDAEMMRCIPLITCAEFGGSCKSTTPNEVDRSKNQILFSLTRAVLNDTSLDCLYTAKFEYGHMYQNCSEIHGAADRLFHVQSNLSPKYLFWKE